MTKREFCAVLGIGAGAALARPMMAWADRIRILGGGGRDPEWLLEAGQVSPEWRKFLAGVRVRHAARPWRAPRLLAPRITRRDAARGGDARGGAGAR